MCKFQSLCNEHRSRTSGLWKMCSFTPSYTLWICFLLVLPLLLSEVLFYRNLEIQNSRRSLCPCPIPNPQGVLHVFRNWAVELEVPVFPLRQSAKHCWSIIQCSPHSRGSQGTHTTTPALWGPRVTCESARNLAESWGCSQIAPTWYWNRSFLGSFFQSGLVTAVKGRALELVCRESQGGISSRGSHSVH